MQLTFTEIILFQDTHWRESFSSAEMQSVYSTTPELGSESLLVIESPHFNDTTKNRADCDERK